VDRRHSLGRIARQGANQPGIAAFFATTDKLISSGRGVRHDDAEDGSRAVRTVHYGPKSAQAGELYLPRVNGRSRWSCCCTAGSGQRCSTVGR
jgi:hypothetical protein